MVFNGLEDKFNAIADQIYAEFSTRDSVAGGTKNDQPFLEFKPNDPNAEQTANDTQFAPIGSTIRDVERMTDFMKSPEGSIFLITEEALQLQNAFSETRVLDPAFVVANAVPFFHAQRPLTTAVDISLTGNSSQQSPASSDINIGAAGRLQVETSNTAIANATGNNNVSSLLNVLPFSGIISALTGLVGISATGILGINDRPEFHVNNTLISIAEWQGFTKQNNIVSGLSSIVSSVESGNIGGIIKGIGNVINDITNPQVSITQQLGLSSGNLTSPSGRDDPANDNTMAGRRYFITDVNNGVDRYLVDSVVADTTGINGISTVFLDDSLGYLNRITFPSYVMPAANSATSLSNVFSSPAFSPLPSISDPFNTGLNSTSIANTISNNQAIIGIASGLSQTATAVSNAARGIAATATPVTAPIGSDFNTLLGNAKNAILQSTTTDNPAENAMLFAALSIRQRYLTDTRVQYILNQLDTQESYEFAYYTGIKPSSNMGFTYAITAPQIGQENTNIPQTITRTGNYLGGGYMLDTFNTLTQNSSPPGILGESSTGTSVSQTTTNLLGKSPDLINIFIYDYVNKNTIPFRAFISNINESVTPQIESTRYIGRVEKNVVYVGVDRKLSFALRIQAFSRGEMKGIWNKINYLTGLCYPAMYSDGFMVPPLIKLTVGDFYRDQPGYFETVVHTIDDQASWEITENVQVPQFVTVQINFIVLDKQQMSGENVLSSMKVGNGDGVFYPMGTVRSNAATPSLGNLQIPANAFQISPSSPVSNTANLTPNAFQISPSSPVSVPYSIPLNTFP